MRKNRSKQSTKLQRLSIREFMLRKLPLRWSMKHGLLSTELLNLRRKQSKLKR